MALVSSFSTNAVIDVLKMTKSPLFCQLDAQSAVIVAEDSTLARVAPVTAPDR